MYPITLYHATLALAQTLDDPAGFLARCAAGTAVSTQETYARIARVYCRWCLEHGRIAVPATDATVLDYLNARAAAGRAYTTICNDVVGIRRLHLHLGAPSPAPPGLRDFLRGVQRTAPHAPPLEILQSQDISLICDLLDEEPNQRLAARNRAMLLLGLGGAMRRSEIVSRDVRDFRFVPEGVEVFIDRSKTDQSGRGRTVPVRRAPEPNLCAVRALLQWRALLARDTGPMFPAFDTRGRPLTRALSSDSFYRWFKTVTALIDAHVAPHSLRATMVTHLIDGGASDAQIMRVTGHRRVESVHRYDRYTNLWSVPSFGELFRL